MTIRYITQPTASGNSYGTHGTHGTHGNPPDRATPPPTTYHSSGPGTDKLSSKVMQNQEAASGETRVTTIHPLKKRFRRNPQSRGRTQAQKQSTKSELVFSQPTLRIFIITIALLSSIVMFAGLEALNRWSGLNVTGNVYGMAAVVTMSVWLPCDVALDLVKLGRKGAKAAK
ncbi:hypothetical protein LTS10_005186 [Elasticomyces elasticus]|nr:hypothetical protein LTS10_005186 [Elasticomyces elasticus]